MPGPLIAGSPLIIGGGPAGAAAAIHLARAGQEVTLLERNVGPADKVCGDFLSVEAVAALRQLGLDVDALGASSIGHLRLVHARRTAEAALPFTARGISRRVLDEALLQHAAGIGVRVRRGEAAHGLTPDGAGLVCRTATEAIRAPAIFLATGKHDLRGAGRPTHRTGPLGLKTYLRLTGAQRADLDHHVELVLFRGGYAGLQPVEGDTAVLCIVIERARFAAAGGTWSTILEMLAAGSPHLRARLAGSVALRDRPVAIAGIPYGYLHRTAPGEPPALFRLGDQACVIPSLTGDGVAIALHSARLAAEAWLANDGAAGHHRRLATALRAQMWLANMLHVLFRGPLAGGVAALGQVAPVLLRQAAALTRVRAG